MVKISLVFVNNPRTSILACVHFCLTSAKIMQGCQVISSLFAWKIRQLDYIGKHDIKKNKLEEIKT